METAVALLLIGVAIPALPAFFANGAGSATVAAILAFLGILILSTVNPLIGGIIWLLGFLPAILGSRAKARREVEERRHQEMLSAIRASKNTGGIDADRVAEALDALRTPKKS